MGGRGQAGEDQDRVVAGRVERAPGLVGADARPCSAPPRHIGNGSGNAANLRASMGVGAAGRARCSMALKVPGRRLRGCPRTAPSTGSVRAVSGSIARITDPAGASAATLSAAANVPPEEMPQKMPSLPDSLRAVSMASASVTGTILWATSCFSTAGTKSGVQPWILCGAHGLPSSSAAPAGSVAMIWVSGRASRSTSPTPVRVPPVPQPVTK